jgi:hypothetical protein
MAKGVATATSNGFFFFLKKKKIIKKLKIKKLWPIWEVLDTIGQIAKI